MYLNKPCWLILVYFSLLNGETKTIFLKGLSFSYFFTLYFLLFLCVFDVFIASKRSNYSKIKGQKDRMNINFRLFYQDEFIINHFRLYNDLFCAYTIRIIGDQWFYNRPQQKTSIFYEI